MANEKVIAKTDKLEYLNNRISEMSELKDGWISGGLAINSAIISFVKDVIKNLDDTELKHIDMGPFINGTIIMTYRDGEKTIGSVNVALYGLSAFMESEKDYKTLEIDYRTDKEREDALTKLLELLIF